MKRRSPTELRPGRAAGLVLAVAACVLFTGAGSHAQQIAAADEFVDTVGVNIHLHYDHTPYKEQFGLVKARLMELGVRHVRDGLIDTTWQGYYDRHNELGDVGITGTFITAFEQGVGLLASYPSRVARAFAAYEAPNEPDKSGDPQWVAKLHRMMERLGQLATIPSVAHFPVIGPSLTHEASYPLVGDVSRHFTSANLHNYLAGRHPGTPGWGGDGYGSIDWNLRVIRPYAGGKPVVTTEIGYQDGPGIEDSVPVEVSGRYMPRVLLEQFRHGIARTFIYELIDFPQSGSYGLLHADGAPKPAFHAVKGLLTLLADPGPAFTPQPLAYSMVAPGEGIRHLAFQKRDGTYFIAVWLEEPSFDMTARRHATVLARSVTLMLPRPMRFVRAHQWQPDGTVTATQHDSVTAAVPFEMSDRLTVLELSETDVLFGRPGPPGPLIPTVTGRDVHLRWQAPAWGGPPDSYQLDAATDPSFASALPLPVDGATTEVAIPGAPPGTYFVRVRATNAAGSGEPSPTVPVMVGMPGVPRLMAERVHANPIALAWLPGVGGPPERWVLSAGSMPGASDLALLPLGQSTRLVASVPLGVQYFVRVAAVGAYGAARSNELSFSVGAAVAPVAPSLHPPRLDGTSVTLSWSAAGEGASYIVLARAWPEGPVIALLPVGAPGLVVPDVPRGTYFVSVVAQRGGLASPESNVVRVDIP